MNENNAVKNAFDSERLGFTAGILLTIATVAAIAFEIVCRFADNGSTIHNAAFHIVVPSLLVLTVILFWTFYLLDRKHKQLMQPGNPHQSWM